MSRFGINYLGVWIRVGLNWSGIGIFLVFGWIFDIDLDWFIGLVMFKRVKRFFLVLLVVR